MLTAADTDVHRNLELVWPLAYVKFKVEVSLMALAVAVGNPTEV